jgi:hypothetical protein
MIETTRAVLVLWMVCGIYTAPSAQGFQQRLENKVVTICGLEISIDPSTGGITRLEYPGPGTMLETTAVDAGLVDMPYPVEQFRPLRLATRFSRGAEVKISEGSATIHWPRLGASRAFVKLEGEVSATVSLRAAPDGRSVLMSCEVENKSPRAIPQVTFPDLRGLTAFAGEEGTQLRTCSFVMRPWRKLRTGDSAEFYCSDNSYAAYAPAGACSSEMVGRWFNLGGLRGGLSLFPRRWGWDPTVYLAMRLSEADNRLRVMCTQAVAIQPGAKWSSGEFLLTPHRNGWARGIEPYRAWVRAHMKREFPVPKRVREGLGFRTLWMCQNQTNDPADVIWKFSDLPAAAREAREHGLDEMVVWFWDEPFKIPFDTPYAHLGTLEDFARAAAECRALGARVVPFISVLSLAPETAKRYELPAGRHGEYTYHTELIPRLNPGYTSWYPVTLINTDNAKWQDEVAEGCGRLARAGLASICWDQYWSAPSQPNVTTLMRRIRSEAVKHDPEASFSGEDVMNSESSCNDLDYTWNWEEYKEWQGFTNAFGAPRRNVNINTSVENVKLGFMENLYLNVMPRRPDSINGSDYVGSHKELSAALKACARLRRQFLPYFVEGTLIGECILTEPVAGARVAAYVLPDRVLVIVLNPMQAPLSPVLPCDLEAWLPGGARGCTVEVFDETGRAVGKSRISAPVRLSPATALKPMGMVLFELSGAKI